MKIPNSDILRQLPQPPSPIGSFRPYRRAGSLLFLSGQGPLLEDGTMARGRVGETVTTKEAAHHARRTGMVLLAVLQDAVGDLRRVAGIVKLFGMVNAVPDFGEHPEVINGCSDLMIEVFGEDGVHSRSAVGVASLPRHITVEIEAVALLA